MSDINLSAGSYKIISGFVAFLFVVCKWNELNVEHFNNLGYSF